jgi:NADH-quinone oxidoreductase subunit F
MRRVLDESPATFDSYRDAGGGEAITGARLVEPEAVIQVVADAGLRGRGGAGFPTGRKWAAVADFASSTIPSTVVVNAAEGEPGSFKDRAILRANPYRVLEGALVAAVAVGADRVVVALKASFAKERTVVQRAIHEVNAAGWAEGIEVTVAVGPSEYLFGEETALLEVLDGRAPFPRVAPPFRHGVDEVGDGVESAAGLELATETEGTMAPPTLVSNLETFANVPCIVVNGPAWFREVGTGQSPGTIVCTVTGDTLRHGVVEVPMGTPLSRVIELAGGGTGTGRTVKAVLSGVANAFLPGALLDTPLTHEDMEACGSGLGAAGFIVFDSTRDLVACAQGVSDFLAVESCGQCEPCKRDGLAISDLLRDVCDSDAPPDAFELLTDLVANVSVGNRCFLATQHERVVGSLLSLFPDEVTAHIERRAHAVAPVRIAPIVDIVEDTAVLDDDHERKQPDWTFNDHDSGKWPADRIDQELHHRHPVSGRPAT